MLFGPYPDPWVGISRRLENAFEGALNARSRLKVEWRDRAKNVAHRSLVYRPQRPPQIKVSRCGLAQVIC